MSCPNYGFAAMVSARLSFHQISHTVHRRKKRKTTHGKLRERTGHVFREVYLHAQTSQRVEQPPPPLDGNFALSPAPVELGGGAQRRAQVDRG